jgi:ornithine cyclodeaminase/alanine dehydrogenase-like protein (mu-crystallin family)
MVLILTEADVNKLLDMKSAVPCLESAFREQSEKRFLMPERQVFKATDSAVVRVMSASMPKLEALGLKVLLGVPAKRKASSTYFAVMLFNPDDASLLAIISAGRLTQLRTGGASAIATKYLARISISTVGILGAGVQGYGQLEGIATTTKLEEAIIFDIDQPRVRSFAETAQNVLGVKVRQAQRLEELYEADVLCTATTSVKPLIFGAKLREGVHLNAIGSNAPNRQEIDHTALLRSRVFVDDAKQALAESGDLVIPIQAGIYKAGSIVGELADVVTGKLKGRTSDSDITTFKSVGIALEDLAVSRAAYELALSRGVGQEIAF